MLPEQKEFLRIAALEVLASCHPVPRPLHAVRRSVNHQVIFHFTDEDLVSALELLRGMGLVEYETERLGVTKWWVATAAGVLHVERKAPANPPRHD